MTGAMKMLLRNMPETLFTNEAYGAFVTMKFTPQCELTAL